MSEARELARVYLDQIDGLSENGSTNFRNFAPLIYLAFGIAGLAFI